MNNPASKDGVWFVYDGACPLCNAAAQALRIQQEHGPLHLVNARESRDHPLMHEISGQGLDLDEGMVIYCGGKFYHGKDALRFMAHAGANKGAFNHLNKTLFRSDAMAAFFYPWLRRTRNVLLRVLNVDKIGNAARTRDKKASELKF